MINNILKYFTSNKDGIEIAIKFGTFIVSIFTFTWAIFSGGRSLRNISIDRKNKQLAEFIVLFSDQNEIKRLSGISGLKRYSKKLFKELFFICAIENNNIIKDLIFESLQKECKHKRKECIQINDFLVDYLFQHDANANEFNLFNNCDYAIRILKNSEIKRKIQFEFNKKNNINIFEQDCAIENYILLSSQLLAFVLAKSYFVRLCGNILTHSNMYSAKWICNSLRNCLVVDNIMRHSAFFMTYHYNCYIDSNSYVDSKFLMSKFSKCIIQNSSFRDVHISKTVFEQGMIEDSVFSKSVIKKCEFSQVLHIKDTKWNGSVIKNTTFNGIKFIQNEMCDIVCNESYFCNINLWRNKILGKIDNCQFVNVHWGGTVLNNVTFTNCVFNNTDFAGAQLSYSRFVNCFFINVSFDKIRDNNTKFDNCTYVNS